MPQFPLIRDFIDGGDTLDKEINPKHKWKESEVIDFLLEVLGTLVRQE